jgi:hypothetical protein
MNATIIPNEIPVIRQTTDADGTGWLYIKIEDKDGDGGWTDVKRTYRKVLEYDGRKYTWISWNSDSMYSVFKTGQPIATIGRR